MRGLTVQQEWALLAPDHPAVAKPSDTVTTASVSSSSPVTLTPPSGRRVLRGIGLSTALAFWIAVDGLIVAANQSGGATSHIVLMGVTVMKSAQVSVYAPGFYPLSISAIWGA